MHDSGGVLPDDVPVADAGSGVPPEATARV
jgi:hypothetical protein